MNKRTAILDAAREEGAIIQRKNTNGVVKESFMLFNVDDVDLVRDWLFEHNLEIEQRNKV